MKLLDFTIKTKGRYPVVTLIPFGCVHADDPGFREDLFRQCVEEIKATPDCLAIGMGDYKNFLRTTARKHLRSYTGDEDSWRDLDQIVRKEAEDFAKRFLTPIKGKLLGLAEGNHYYEFSTGGTDTQYLCQLLDVPYLDKPAFIRLRLDAGGDATGTRVLKMIVHHGDWSGGYSRAGGDVNAAEMKALGFDFDIYLFSHTHRLWGMHVPSLTIPSTGKLRPVERPRAFVRTGCFVRGYDEKCAGRYAQKKLLNPTALGYARLLIKIERKYNAANYAERCARMPREKAASSAYEPASVKFEVRY